MSEELDINESWVLWAGQATAGGLTARVTSEVRRVECRTCRKGGVCVWGCTRARRSLCSGKTAQWVLGSTDRVLGFSPDSPEVGWNDFPRSLAILWQDGEERAPGLELGAPGGGGSSTLNGDDSNSNNVVLTVGQTPFKHCLYISPGLLNPRSADQ